ncbi:hypothetical protein HDU96_008973 [Phlyctochytrium bullatum]|nr:hypothetical protein HDU96_008973 [Phlyctochytrium bullatum]
MLFGLCTLQAASPASALRLLQTVDTPKECEELARLANFRCAVADLPDTNACFARATQSQQDCKDDLRTGASANFRFVFEPEATQRAAVDDGFSRFFNGSEPDTNVDVSEDAADDALPSLASTESRFAESNDSDAPIGISERSQKLNEIRVDKRCTTEKCCEDLKTEYISKCGKVKDTDGPECAYTFDKACTMCLEGVRKTRSGAFATVFTAPVVILEKFKTQITGRCTFDNCCDYYSTKGEKLCDKLMMKGGSEWECNKAFLTAETKCLEEIKSKNETVFHGLYHKYNQIDSVHQPRRVMVSALCTNSDCCDKVERSGEVGCNKNKVLDFGWECNWIFEETANKCRDDVLKAPFLYIGEYVALDIEITKTRVKLAGRCTQPEVCCKVWGERGIEECLKHNLDASKQRTCHAFFDDAAEKCEAELKKKGMGVYFADYRF